MPKKKRTPAQLEADKRRSEMMKAAPLPPKNDEEVFDRTDFQEPDLPNSEILRQLKEVQETNALLKAALLGKTEGPTISANGVLGEVEKYTLDPDNYPDPTKRLAAEPKLVQAINFPYNYELQYQFSTRPYVTKSGVNMIEPEFMVQLDRIVINQETGEQTDKRYIARKLIFHEDPQAALIIARDNNIEVDESDQKVFLNEMRYLRVRDWLFDVFWPGKVDGREEISEEAIGGTIVQVFTKSSVDEAEIPFDKLHKTKLV